MAEELTIWDMFVRYGLPILIGYIVIFQLFLRLWTPLFKVFRMKVLSYTLCYYWKKVNTCHKTELEQMFAPLHKLKKKNENQKLRIVEIGIGEGANFAFYPQNCEVFGIDPEGDIETILRENAAKYDSLVLKDFKAAGAEDMSHIDDDSVDAVVSTLVLCTVEDPVKVVSEVKRILRKDGVFVFWEHIYASNSKWTSLMQRFFFRIWFILYSGCHLTRKSAEYIKEARFANHECSTIMLDVPSVMSTTLCGSATK